MPRLLLATAALALGAVLASAVAVLSTADASAASSHKVGVIVFHKNDANTLRSTLTWRVVRVRGSERTVLRSRSWRAGSGFTRTSTNSCKRNDGWLPDGTYRPRLFADYPGSLIKGRAIYLGNKPCANGTIRSELFIHTETGANNRQCADRPGDQLCRWEYPKINDYRSYGCVKLSPHDMHELFSEWRRYFTLGYDARVKVRVR